MSSNTFRRKEVKFLLSSRQRAALEAAMAGHMQADEYGESTIASLYYDTPDRRLIRRSLEKPLYKEKLRLRSYGVARPDSTVYVELKKKYDGIVYKRRIAMTQAEADRWLSGRAPCPREGQIAREIDWFLGFYGCLEPAMVLSYDRIAYFCPQDENLRLTLDRNIRWRTDRLTLTAPALGEQLLGPGQSLLEVKCAGAMPLWLVEALNANGIRQSSFSKYGTAYSTVLNRELLQKGGVNCA